MNFLKSYNFINIVKIFIKLYYELIIKTVNYIKVQILKKDIFQIIFRNIFFYLNTKYYFSPVVISIMYTYKVKIEIKYIYIYI